MASKASTMGRVEPSGIKTLNYGLVTFLIAFPLLILIYSWAVGGLG